MKSFEDCHSGFDLDRKFCPIGCPVFFGIITPDMINYFLNFLIFFTFVVKTLLPFDYQGEEKNSKNFNISGQSIQYIFNLAQNPPLLRRKYEGQYPFGVELCLMAADQLYQPLRAYSRLWSQPNDELVVLSVDAQEVELLGGNF